MPVASPAPLPSAAAWNATPPPGLSPAARHPFRRRARTTTGVRAAARWTQRRSAMTGSRVLAFVAHEFREMVPPTLFFAAGFNLIMLTTQLVLDDYRLQFFNFMIATAGALLVGKAVLVANALPFLRRFDDAPLILPVLFKTTVYVVVVLLVRLLEKLIEFLVEGGTLAGLPAHVRDHFSWHRFVAVQIWIVVLFLVYTTAGELNALLGDGALARVFFAGRPSGLGPARRRRTRTLAKLSRLARAHTPDELRDGGTTAHAELLGLIGELAKRPAATAASVVLRPRM
jgi:hypothetical protein